jgi:hypothetical protein
MMQLEMFIIVLCIEKKEKKKEDNKHSNNRKKENKIKLEEHITTMLADEYSYLKKLEKNRLVYLLMY